ncbi:MAG: phosphate ABC transporter permease PstA [Azospirillaceae bacterium]
MTDAVETEAPAVDHRPHASARAEQRLRRRYAADRRFQIYGIVAIGLAMTMLAVLLVSIVSKGYTAFVQTGVVFEITYDPEVVDPSGERDPSVLRRADYQSLIDDRLYALFPDVEERLERRELRDVVSTGAGFMLRDRVVADPSLIGTTEEVWLPLSSDLDQVVKGNIPRDVPEAERPVSDRKIAWLDALDEQGFVDVRFNTILFTFGNSRDPEMAGILGAVVGSALTLVVTLLLSFPIGVAAAIYLEEFAPKNRWTDLVEVNINNLAAVPSIVFGLLGLAVFLSFFGLPRSAPVVGGLVLTLMTLPTIIISSRAALKAVPPSIREGALGIGASPLQTVMHHVLPLALPGMLTGAIIGMAQALGETAPLLMIGMVAFIVDIPGGFTDSATVLPVQIYMWADLPERAFVERTSAAIMILLGFLVAMNALAVLLRKKLERRW